MPDQLRERILSSTAKLPAMPGAATRVMELLRRPETDAARLEEAIRYDPVLTADVLRMANSAYFGLSGKVGSVRQAAVQLGWRRLSNLVTASAVSETMCAEVRGYELSPGALWRHAVAVAVATEELSRALDKPIEAEGFTAALLHDVGKLILGNFVSEEYARIEAESDHGMPFEEAERRILGIDHAEVGAYILENWHFPGETALVARWHHEPELSITPSLLLDMVHVADTLCLAIGFGLGREGLRYKPSAKAMDRLGVRMHQLEKAASLTLEGMTEIIQSLKIPKAEPCIAGGS